MFSSLNSEDFNRVIDKMKPLMASKGEKIIKIGEFGNLFYCVESGAVEVVVNGHVVGTFESGECFGELSQIYNTAEQAIAKVRASCLLWTLDLE